MKPKFNFALTIDKPTAYRIKNSHTYQIHNSNIRPERRTQLSQASFLVERRILPEIKSHLTAKQKQYAPALWLWVNKVKQEELLKFPTLDPLTLLRKKVVPQLSYKNFINVAIPMLDAQFEKSKKDNKEATQKKRLEAKALKLSGANASECAILKKLGLNEAEALALAKTLSSLLQKY